MGNEAYAECAASRCVGEGCRFALESGTLEYPKSFVSWDLPARL